MCAQHRRLIFSVGCEVRARGADVDGSCAAVDGHRTVPVVVVVAMLPLVSARWQAAVVRALRMPSCLLTVVAGGGLRLRGGMHVPGLVARLWLWCRCTHVTAHGLQHKLFRRS